ncbi:MAG: glutamine-hydrolyzing carbamoyl-phosphate synthase small subunit [Candidatus Peregrinibacteria bacterium]|nr:glutamine-hydrolyzing carbamoyl-phosphate synthase small subunit [Candidatus Peregrinibacteria bacterium]
MKTLYLSNGDKFSGKSFGADTNCDGEVVFTTGMTGYDQILTDPSYYGQIVVFTYPLIGNYGVAEFSEEKIDPTFESKKIWVKGVVLTEFSEKYSHSTAHKSFANWLKEENIPAIHGVDTREITQVLREEGCILGSLSDSKPAKFEDPLDCRFVPEVSPEKVEILEPENPTGKTIAFIDCGAKDGILRNFLKRGIKIIRFPFNANPFEWQKSQIKIDGLFLSNGPGDPDKCYETIQITKEALTKNIPIFGICLGNQIIALAAGGKTRKMKYGHRGVNQPVGEIVNKTELGKCLITSQNHGYEVDPRTLPDEFEVWFKNLNDNSVEGIKHKTKPIFSVQFHPESCAGPEDAEYLFDEFISKL